MTFPTAVTASARVERLMQHLRTGLSERGYTPIVLPIIADVDLFLARSGDQTVARMLTFERFGRQLALRPEFTALAAHQYAQQFADGDTAVRWHFGGAIFEDMPDGNPQQPYQRLSVGAECLGAPPSAAVDAEVMMLAAHGVGSVTRTGWRLNVGHVGLLRGVLRWFGLDARTERYVLNHLHELSAADGPNRVADNLRQLLAAGVNAEHDAISEVAAQSTQQMYNILLAATERGAVFGGRSSEDVVRRLLQKRRRAAELDRIEGALQLLHRWAQVRGPWRAATAQLAALLPDAPALHALLSEWQASLHTLEANGVDAQHINVVPTLARDWDYYTGIVFEVRTAESAVAGGGRYDELVHLLGSRRDVPAVGLAFYVDTLLPFADSENA